MRLRVLAAQIDHCPDAHRLVPAKARGGRLRWTARRRAPPARSSSTGSLGRRGRNVVSSCAIAAPPEWICRAPRSGESAAGPGPVVFRDLSSMRVAFQVCGGGCALSASGADVRGAPPLGKRGPTLDAARGAAAARRRSSTPPLRGLQQTTAGNRSGPAITGTDFTHVLRDAKAKIAMDGRGRWIDRPGWRRHCKPACRPHLPVGTAPPVHAGTGPDSRRAAAPDHQQSLCFKTGQRTT